MQAIHYFANTSQLFLSDLMARGGRLRPEDQVMLTIEYEDPETQDPETQDLVEPTPSGLPPEVGRDPATGDGDGRVLPLPACCRRTIPI